MSLNTVYEQQVGMRSRSDTTQCRSYNVRFFVTRSELVLGVTYLQRTTSRYSFLFVRGRTLVHPHCDASSAQWQLSYRWAILSTKFDWLMKILNFFIAIQSTMNFSLVYTYNYVAEINRYVPVYWRECWCCECLTRVYPYMWMQVLASMSAWQKRWNNRHKRRSFAAKVR